MSDIDEFWSQVEKTPGCWRWKGRRYPDGYGVFSARETGWRVRHRAHRFSWQLAHGPIPAGMFICHRCDNPPCVRPDHLFLGTVADNSRDAAAKGRLRGPRWDRHNLAKLNPDLVREARRRHQLGERGSSIARSMGVTHGAISSLLRGITWRHVI